MSEINIGSISTRLEKLASEYQSCIVNIHNLIYQFGGDEDVIATLVMMRDIMDATIGSLKRRYVMVYSADCTEVIDLITGAIRKIVEHKNNDTREK